MDMWNDAIGCNPAPLRRPCDHEYVVYVYDVTSVEFTRDATLTSLLSALKHFMLKNVSQTGLGSHRPQSCGTMGSHRPHGTTAGLKPIGITFTLI